MKRVLIIANLFHASPRIPGAAKYLPEFGWEPTILTVPLKDDWRHRLSSPAGFFEKARIIEIPYRGDIFWFWRKIFKLFRVSENRSIPEQMKEKIGIKSKKSFIDIIMNLYQEIFAYPDTEKTWRKPALNVAINILREEHFDVILSTSPFSTSHIIASKLKEKFNMPWVADFRDPWTKNHNYTYGAIRRYFEEKLEKKIISNADVIITAAPAYTKKQEDLHEKATITIPNGFDPENLNTKANTLAKKFTITYTGTIYTGKQDPEKFFVAIRNLISKKEINQEDLEINFYGISQNWLDHTIKSYNFENVAKQHGRISREESLKKQKESQVLLYFNWEDEKEKGIYGLKVFEYFSSQRPILATGGFPED